MDRLGRDVKAVLQMRQQLIVNKCNPSSVTESIDFTHRSVASQQATTSSTLCSSESLANVVATAESLVTHLILVLSEGLWPGLDLWSVIVSLERVAKLSPAQANKYRFAFRLTTSIKSSFPVIAEHIKTRAFFRAALNQGCLLATLEIIGRCFQPIVESYMMDNAILRQYGNDKWDRFVGIIAPIGGPPLDAIEAKLTSSSNSQTLPAFLRGGGGGDGVSVQSEFDDDTSCFAFATSSAVLCAAGFDLDLVVPEFDFHSAYMHDVKMYLAGLLPDGQLPKVPIEVVVELAPTASPDEEAVAGADEQDGTGVAVATDISVNAEDDDTVAPSAAVSSSNANSETAITRTTRRVVKRIVVKRVLKKGTKSATSEVVEAVGGEEGALSADAVVTAANNSHDYVELDQKNNAPQRADIIDSAEVVVEHVLSAAGVDGTPAAADEDANNDRPSSSSTSSCAPNTNLEEGEQMDHHHQVEDTLTSSIDLTPLPPVMQQSSPSSSPPPKEEYRRNEGIDEALDVFEKLILARKDFLEERLRKAEEELMRHAVRLE